MQLGKQQFGRMSGRCMGCRFGGGGGHDEFSRVRSTDRPSAASLIFVVANSDNSDRIVDSSARARIHDDPYTANIWTCENAGGGSSSVRGMALARVAPPRQRASGAPPPRYPRQYEME